MGWSVRFIPNKCQSISVSINSQFWMTWHIHYGNIRVSLPSQWVDFSPIKVYAIVHPEGKNGRMEVYWNNVLKQKFELNGDEEHVIEKR